MDYGYKSKPTLVQVVSFKMKKEISEEAKRLAGGTTNARVVFGCYQKARSHVMRGLDEEQQQQLEKEREKWEEHGLPEKEKARYASMKHGAIKSDG